MTFSHVILKNLKHNISKFTSYIFVNVFVISMLFTYGSIIFNPNISEDPVLSSSMDFVYMGVIAILLFSIVFVSYTGIYFVKTRGQELGVYLTLGMTKSKLIKMILIENSVIMIISVAIGMLVGLLFSGIFYLILGSVLDVDNLFYLDQYSFLLGIGVFAIVFICNMIYSILFIKKSNIKAITVSDKTKGMKQPSVISGCIGVLLFTLSTTLVYLIFTDNDLVSNLNEYTTEAIMISVFVQFSSLYLILATGLDFIVNLLSKRRSFYHKNILLLSNLKYSFTTYKTTLFLLTLLMGMSVLFMGIQLSFKVGGTELMNTVLPYDMMIESTDDYNHITNEEINDIATDLGGGITDFTSYEYKSSQIFRNQPNWFYYFGITTMIISESEYNNAFNQNIDIAPDELYIMVNDDMNYGDEIINYDTYLTTKPYTEGDKLSSLVRSEDMTLNQFESYTNDNDIQVLEYSKDNTYPMYSSFINSYGEIEFAAVHASVIDDSVYDSITTADTNNIKLFNLDNVDQEQYCNNLKDELRTINDSPNSWQSTMTERQDMDSVESYQPICKSQKVEETDKAMAMFSFTMTFISILFLIASSVVLYYKLVNDIDYERKQIDLYRKIGIDEKVSNKYLSTHTAFIFFTPLVLGGLIGLLYTYTFFHSLPAELVSQLTTIVLIMFVGFIIYDLIFFIIIRRILLRRIMN